MVDKQAMLQHKVHQRTLGAMPMAMPRIFRAASRRSCRTSNCAASTHICAQRATHLVTARMQLINHLLVPFIAPGSTVDKGESCADQHCCSHKA